MTTEQSKAEELLKVLPVSQRAVMVQIMTRIDRNLLEGLDVIAVPNQPNVFRLKVGKHRLIFRKWQTGNEIIVLATRG